VDWPEALISELASRRCIVFLGAGVSAGCISEDGNVRPPTWPQLLERFKELMRRDEDKATADAMIQKEKFLDAAEIMLSSVSRGDFTSFIRQQFVIPRFQPSPIHVAVLKIDPKVVITTNFDNIYDSYCTSGMAADGYNICRYYETHFVTDLRSPVRLIVKAHGCVSNPAKIVLTRSDYFGARQEYGNFYKILDALFLTNTLFFVGYTLTDPDIQLVLENVNIAASSDHPHYALIPDDIHASIKSSAEKSYNIEFIQYEPGNYDEVNESLSELAVQVIQFREKQRA
jgi:hypothetical protein